MTLTEQHPATYTDTYRQVSCDDFLGALIDQEIELDSRLEGYVQSEPDQPVSRLVAATEREIHRFNIGHGLVSDIVDEPVFEGDESSEFLRCILNSTIDPIGKSEVDTYFGFNSAHLANPCESVEGFFALTFDDMINGAYLDGTVEHGGEIYLDRRGQAIALRKASSFSSAIALKQIVIRGIPWPVGSVMYLESPDGIQGYDEENEIAMDRFVVRPFGDIRDLRITRMTAFSVSPWQRELTESQILLAQSSAWTLRNLKPHHMQPLVQSVADSIAA